MADKKPMKGEAPDPKWPISFPMYFSIKFDGIRILMDGHEPKTNSMKSPANNHLKHILRNMPGMLDLDMEVIIGDPADPLCYNSTYSAVAGIQGEPNFNFYVFDVVDLEHDFEQRQAFLQTLKPHLPPCVIIVDQWLIESQEQLDALYAKVTGDGHEGLIGRRPKGMYKYGRATAKSQDCLKLKPEEDFEFEIVDYYEAEANNNEAFINEMGRTARSSHAENKVGKGTLGGFIGRALNGQFKGQTFRCPCGKLKHDERQKIWDNQDAYRQHIGVARHFPIGVVDAPRQARFNRWRGKDDMSLPD